MTQRNSVLKHVQEANCRGCYYADLGKVGTGQPCCTKATPPRLQAYECLDRRPAPSSN